MKTVNRQFAQSQIQTRLKSIARAKFAGNASPIPAIQQVYKRRKSVLYYFILYKFILLPNLATQINKSQLSLNAIPKQNPMETSSLLKIDPMEFVDSQYDDPLGDPSDQNYSTTLPGKKSSLSMAAKSNRTSDTEFRLNFVDLLTTDNDLNGWTGVESFDSLRSLMKHIPNGENIAAGYGMSLRNLIVMVLVRTKMNIPFEQMSVLFPMKAKLLAKCFSEFLPVLEAATSTSIPAIAKSQANIQGTVLILERPVITTIGKIQRITTRKNSIRVNSAGKITAVISTSVPLPETSNDQMKSTQQQDSERIKSANISSTDFQDNMLIKVGVIEQPQPTLTKCRTAPTVPTSTASTSIAIAPAKTAECKQTIERIKSYRILNEKVAPSMTLYMDMIVRLVCGVMNFNKTTSFSDTILKW